MLLWPFNKYPGTDYETFNWEWILKTVKEYTAKVDDFIEDINDTWNTFRNWVTHEIAKMHRDFAIYVNATEGALNTGAIADGAITFPKLNDTIKIFVTPEMYGAAGDGVTDDTAAVQSAFSAPYDVVFRDGKTYRVTQPLNIPENKAIYGSWAKIVYEKEQDGTPSYEESCLNIIDSDNVQIYNLEIEYDGTYDLGAYGGFISGVYVENSDFFRACNLKIHGFNRSGICIGMTSDYCDYPICEKCNCYNNRVAGIIYGNTESGIVRDCTLNYNGLSTDYTVGYGFAGWSESMPNNTKLLNNTANNNSRKGLDFHAGNSGTIQNNTCSGNKVTGIYVLGAKISGTWDINNNIISDMTVNTNSYQVYCLHIGGEPAQIADSDKCTFNVHDNTFKNISVILGVLYIVHESMECFTDGVLNFFDNVITVESATAIYLGTNNVESRTKAFDVAIKNNYFHVSRCFGTSYPFYVRSDHNRKKTFSGNIVVLDESASTVGLIGYDTTYAANYDYAIQDNMINVPSALVDRDYDLFNIRRLASDKMTNNIVNNNPWRNWDGFRYEHNQASSPDSMYWSKGSIIWNTNPGSGVAVGWVCTDGGAPGTWIAFSTLT